MIQPMELEQIWREHNAPSFTLVESQPEDNRCEFARQYALWFQETLIRLGDTPTIPLINQIRLLTLDKRFELKHVIPSMHYENNPHICIDEVFEQAYYVLKAKIISDPEYSTLCLPQPLPVENSSLQQRSQPIVQLAATPLTMGILSPEVVKEQQELAHLAMEEEGEYAQQ